jgi:DinB superfamily
VEEADVAELTYEAARDGQRRIAAGESDVETEARQHTLAELARAVRLTRGMLQAIPESWSDAQLNLRPPAGRVPTAEANPSEDRWSACEALTHIIATQNWYLLHMTRLLGRREHFDVMVRGLGDLARQGLPAAQVAVELRDATQRFLDEIARILPDADLEATRPSTYFGELSLRGWVMLAVQHDVQHFEQIQRLTQLPEFAGAR